MYPEIPGYQMLRHIGRGSQSDVYLALQLSLDRQVAVKVMVEGQGDADFRAMFLREGRTIGQLRHPHVITIHDIGDFPQGYFIVMEYAEGGTLIDHMRRGLSRERILLILRQQARALGYIHERDIIHRDVKSTNILFRNDNESLLSDFGIAKNMVNATALTAVDVAVGTPGYMSPEQERGLPLDGRSDLYSLGVVFHKMLLSHYLHQQPPDATPKVDTGDSFPPQQPAGLELYQPIIDGLLQRDRERRFASAAELLQALDNLGGPSARAAHRSLNEYVETSAPTILTQTASPATNTAPLPPLTGSLQRSRRGMGWVAGALGAAALVLGLVGSGYWWLQHNAPPSNLELAETASSVQTPHLPAQPPPDEAPAPQAIQNVPPPPMVDDPTGEEAITASAPPTADDPGSGETTIASAPVEALPPTPPPAAPPIGIDGTDSYQPQVLDYFVGLLQNDTMRSGDR
ncbi:MAG: serine/threonine-protein kinase, partial [Candidatus Competibacterales bacterium]